MSGGFSMDAAGSGTISRFSDRVLRLLERCEHRCAKTFSEKEAVYRLRYEAYAREGLIEPRADHRLWDSVFDNAPNAWITTTFIDGELASTVRVNVAIKGNGAIPSSGAFSDAIRPHLQAGATIVDPTRLAAQIEVARQIPELPYIALRPAWVAGEYFGADFGLVSIVEQHQAFYRRVFGYEAWCEPREYPNVNCKITCMGLDFRAGRERVEARYPFFRSTPAEREALFGPETSERTQPRPGYEDLLGTPSEPHSRLGGDRLGGSLAPPIAKPATRPIPAGRFARPNNVRVSPRT